MLLEHDSCAYAAIALQRGGFPASPGHMLDAAHVISANPAETTLQCDGLDAPLYNTGDPVAIAITPHLHPPFPPFSTPTKCAGVAPTAAMRLLQQLQLFAIVFSPPPALASVLGTGYGAQCVEVIAAAESLVTALDLQVGWVGTSLWVFVRGPVSRIHSSVVVLYAV